MYFKMIKCVHDYSQWTGDAAENFPILLKSSNLLIQKIPQTKKRIGQMSKKQKVIYSVGG